MHIDKEEPLLDIVSNKATGMKNILEFERGFLAETPDEYALAMHRILS